MKAGENYLITTDNWFFAPDGTQYRAVFGKVEILHDSFLGIKTNMRSTNWYVKVGDESNHVILAGCQVHYAVKTDICNTNYVDDENVKDGEVKLHTHKSYIYRAE